MKDTSKLCFTCMVEKNMVQKFSVVTNIFVLVSFCKNANTKLTTQFYSRYNFLPKSKKCLFYVHGIKTECIFNKWTYVIQKTLHSKTQFTVISIKQFCALKISLFLMLKISDLFFSYIETFLVFLRYLGENRLIR